jgi:hypothetical protein
MVGQPYAQGQYGGQQPMMSVDHMSNPAKY